MGPVRGGGEDSRPRRTGAERRARVTGSGVACGALAVRFPTRFDAAYRILFIALRLAPSDSFVEVDGDEVRVRMAWAFRARFPRSAVASVVEHQKRPLSRGVHGLAGRWLVNGSGQGIVNIALEPTQRGHVLGFPVRLRNLLVSVETPTA